LSSTITIFGCDPNVVIMLTIVHAAVDFYEFSVPVITP
jgi:hypothetical protein